MGLAGSLLVVSLVIGLVIGLVQARIEAVDLPGGWILVQAIGLVVPFTLAFLALLLVYRFIPSGPVRLRHVWPAALLAALAWTVLQALLSLWATRVADYANVFGPISSAVTLVVFVFASAVIVLLGASLANAWLVDETTESLPSQA
jgi:membrane protein